MIIYHKIIKYQEKAQLISAVLKVLIFSESPDDCCSELNIERATVSEKYTKQTGIR